MAVVGSQSCPHCNGTVLLEAPWPFGATSCAACGRALWYLTIDGSISFFRHADAQFVWDLFVAIPEHQRPPRHLVVDQLDLVEIVSEFKAALARAK
jgi:hypothetical protein